jgi:sulfatase modifying factor 1
MVLARILICGIVLHLATDYLMASDPSTQRAKAALPTTRNSLGMDLVQIPAGKFMMGSDAGNFDEKPVHEVIISSSFWMATTDVTNAQYEQFDPLHRKLRGKNGISIDDDEAVVYVSCEEADRFSEWLTKRESRICE